MAEPLASAGDFALVETLADEDGLGEGDVFVRGDRADHADALGILAGGHEPGCGMEQGAETVPVTGHTDVAGDDLIEGRDDGLGRGRIGGRGGLDRRRRRRRPGGDRSGAGQDEGGREDGKAHQMFSRKGDYDSPTEGVSSAERRPQTLSKTGPACPNTDVFR